MPSGAGQQKQPARPQPTETYPSSFLPLRLLGQAAPGQVLRPELAVAFGIDPGESVPMSILGPTVRPLALIPANSHRLHATVKPRRQLHFAAPVMAASMASSSR